MADNLSRYVEGPFKNFTIRRIRPEDVEKVSQHIKDHFLHDEPFSKLLGYSEEYGEDFLHIFKHFLPDNLGFWMEDNETGEVAAVRATFVAKKGDNCFDSFPMRSRTEALMYKMCVEAEKIANTYERFGITKYGSFLVASCAPKYRNQGLTKELYRRSLVLLKAEGLPLARSVFTSPYTRAAVRSLGFEELSRVYFKDLKDDDGKPVFDPSKLNDEHFAAVMVKLL